jgi:hypothetical protein
MACIDDLGGDIWDIDREWRGRVDVSGVDEKAFSSNEKVDSYGLPDAALEASDPVPILSFFERPPQFSRML